MPKLYFVGKSVASDRRHAHQSGVWATSAREAHRTAQALVRDAYLQWGELPPARIGTHYLLPGGDTLGITVFEAEYIPRWVVVWGQPGYLYDNQSAYPNKRTAMRAAAAEARMDRVTGRRVTGNARDGYDVAQGTDSNFARIDLYPVPDGSQGDWLDAYDLTPVVNQTPAKLGAA